MTNIIPITPATIDIITKLNDGVRPAFEDEETFYVYRGENEHADIISAKTLNEWPDEYMAVVKILYKN